MWYERIFFSTGKAPALLLWFTCAATMAAVAYLHVESLFLVLIVYIPLIIYMEEHSRSAKLVGFLYSRRHAAAAVFLTLCTIVACIIFARDYGVPTHDRLGGTSKFLIVGIMLGALTRQQMRHLSLLALFGKKRLESNIALVAIWTIVIMSFPLRDKVAEPWYIFGMGLGFLIEKSSSLRIMKAAAAYRRLQEIAGAWPPGIQTKWEELTALRLLSQGRQIPFMRFSSLRRYLDQLQSEGKFTKRLALISASVYRLEGKYDNAVSEVDRFMEPFDTSEDAHLALLKIISLEELDREEEADEELENLMKSEDGQICPIANSLKARRLAESTLLASIDVESFDIIEPNTGVLSFARKAMELRRKVALRRARGAKNTTEAFNLFLGKFADLGVPITPSFMIDVVGYSYLASGHPEEARLYLKNCIEIDPVYSYSYLHLGDYFLLRNVFARALDYPSDADLWHAAACYWAAFFTERNEDSRVKRLARKRLMLVTSTKQR